MTVRVHRTHTISRAAARTTAGAEAATASLAKEAEEIAKNLAPKGETKKLHGSIEATKTDSGWAVVARKFYAKFQEFGTVHHAPQPFLRPAAEAVRQKVSSAYAKAIRVVGGNRPGIRL